MVLVTAPHLHRLAPVLALLVGAALAGCVDDAADPAPPTLPFDREALRFPTALYFGDAWSLVEAEPVGDTRLAPLGDFYTKWAVGSGFPEWRGAPVDEPLLVTGQAELRFWITADSVVTSTPGIFPDFVVYFGTTESVLSVVSPTRLDPVHDDLSVIQEGEAVLVSATFELPPGGVTVPTGAGIRVVTAPVMMESDAADLYVMYGSQEAPSQVRFNVTYLDDEPWAGRTADVMTTSHMLVAGSFLHGEEVEGVNVLSRTVAVTNDTQALLVDLDFTGSTPFPDMDLYVYGPNGTEFALSVTPGSDEAVHLYRHNLEAGGVGTWGIKVVNYVTPTATFDLRVARL